MKDYWNRITDWLYPDEQTRVIRQVDKYVWRTDTVHSGQIPSVDIPLHTTYIIQGPSGTLYIEANTLSISE